MRYVRGPLMTVTDPPIGSVLVGDHEAGITELQVADGIEFNEAPIGGLLQVGDEQIAYTGIDDDTDTIELADPTLLPWGEGTEVVVLPATRRKRLTVKISDDGEPAEVDAPSIWFPMIDAIIANPDAQYLVTLKDYGDGRYELHDIPNVAKTISGDTIVGPLPNADIPTGGGPTEAPTVAPVVTAAPFAIGTVRVTIEPVDAELDAAYEVAASLTSPVAEDGSDTVGSTTGTVFDIASLYEAQIPFDAPTFVKVRAVNSLGAGPWSDEASATPRQADEEFISALWAYLGNVEANQISSGVMDAVVAFIGTLTVGNDLIEISPPTSTPDGSGGYVLEGGVIIRDPDNPDGEPLVRLHPMGCTFKGRLTADIVTVLQDLVINGNARLSGGSTFTLTNGVADPLAGPTWTVGPAAGQSWPAAPSGYVRRGATWDATNGRWLELLKNTSTNRAYFRTVSTAGVAGTLALLGPSQDGTGSNLTEYGGIATNGSSIWHTARSGTNPSTGNGVLCRSSMTGAYIERTAQADPGVGPHVPGGAFWWAGTLGDTGLLYQFNGTVYWLEDGDLGLSPDDLNLDGTPASYGRTSIWYGTADFGDQRLVVARETGEAEVYDLDNGWDYTGGSLTATQVTAKNWTTGSASAGALHWDGSNFLTLASTATALSKWSGYYPSSDGTWSAVYADKTSGGTTKASPATTSTVAARQYATLTLGPLPAGASGSDVWVGYAASGNAATKYKRSETLSGRTLLLTGKSTAGSTTIPATSTAGGSPAVIKSGATPGWEGSGDGSWKVKTPTAGTHATPKDYVDAATVPSSGAGSVTNATGYALSNVTLFKLGTVVHFLVTVVRSANPASSGYITFGIIPAGFRPAITTPLNAGVQSVAASWTPKAQVLSDGQAQIAMNPSGGSANGMNVTGTWIAAS